MILYTIIKGEISYCTTHIFSPLRKNLNDNFSVWFTLPLVRFNPIGVIVEYLGKYWHQTATSPNHGHYSRMTLRWLKPLSKWGRMINEYPSFDETLHLVFAFDKDAIETFWCNITHKQKLLLIATFTKSCVLNNYIYLIYQNRIYFVAW